MPAWLRFPWPFPPQGGLLVVFCALYVVPGLIGHDPWKSDDAVHLGVAWSMLRDGHWIAPQLAGTPWSDFPPLYYWVAAVLGKAFSWLLPAHDAMRLASGLFIALMLAGLADAARRFFGREAAAPAALLGMGCLGLVTHAHDAQPLTALLAAMAWTFAGLARLRELPAQGSLVLAAAIGAGALAAGIGAFALLVPLVLLMPLAHADWRNHRTAAAIVAALALANLPLGLWLHALADAAPAQYAGWWARQFDLWIEPDQPPERVTQFLGMLAWYGWPAVPLAVWALWRARKTLRQPGLLVALVAFALALGWVSLTQGARSLLGLPLLPPLALLAVAGAGSLKRGAANAFDWFAMMSFSVFAAVFWLGWVAQVSGWPAQLARNVGKLQPGFAAQVEPLALLWALALTAGWFWLIFASPRAPYRAVVHWAAGITLVWNILMSLWLPWIDYGRSYRPLAASLARALPREAGCIAGRDLGEAQRASFHYFAGIVTRTAGSSGATACRLTLVQAASRDPENPPGVGWSRIWQGRRASDRHEIFRLYRREEP